MVCGIEAAPLEDDGYRVEDAAGFALAVRTDADGLLVEALPALEAPSAGSTFILIGGHRFYLGSKSCILF
jgi:hypothetical protein